MGNEVQQALLMDLLLAAGLLVLFLYVARISREVRGVAAWGWMHFVYTLGTTGLDSIGPMLAATGTATTARVVQNLGVLIACIAMAGIALATLQFVRQRALRRREIAFLVAAGGVSLLTWIGWGTRDAQTVALTLVELAALAVMIWQLQALRRAPERVPAWIMVACCGLLWVLYASAMPGWWAGKFGIADIWVSVDVSTWFLLNFCMLMLASFRAAEGLRRSAMTDPLTGALNRRGFENALQPHVQAASGGSGGAALSLDVDDFKRINDRHGHATGDEVLTRFAACVRDLLRTGDLFERAGGDEFIVFLPGADFAVANGVAQRIRETIAGRAMHARAQPGEITVSIGVHAEADQSVGKLIRRADVALYRAKQLGRNRVESTPAPLE